MGDGLTPAPAIPDRSTRVSCRAVWLAERVPDGYMNGYTRVVTAALVGARAVGHLLPGW